uniref:E3 ubiquitin-protein ligase APD1-4 middle domain-containing protein n=1 Tax=Daphnia galeata TaxID=27404 RepID=A0A8J2WM93_9CRUS|nr:unnamed protein product [Daphnia galeata]
MTSLSGNQQTYEYHAVNNFEVDSFEVRLENRSSGCWSSSSVKLVQLCCIGILLPIVWIIIPVYARFFLYANSAVPLSFTQMRVLDSNFSTFWCQGHHIYTNVSLIDAYLMDRNPIASYQAQQMTHHFELDDDLKEFWGFYLLKGSKLTVRSCARHMGATVTLVKGNSSLNLLSCLKEGFSSSEEVSIELKENVTLEEKGNLSPLNLSSSERPSEDTQSVEISDVTINESTNVSKLYEEVEEIENAAFEMNEDETIKEKDMLTNPLTSDMSESEESLTSSSEEALLACASPIMNQFVVPDENCDAKFSTKYSLLEYIIEDEGYYSIIFSSNFEQRGQVINPVSTKIDLLQNIYNTTNAVASCYNTTECNFSLRFASSERVVVALSTPYYDENSNRDSTFSVESQCVPRTSVYLAFGLTLPLVLILCAFL